MGGGGALHPLASRAQQQWGHQYPSSVLWVLPCQALLPILHPVCLFPFSPALTPEILCGGSREGGGNVVPGSVWWWGAAVLSVPPGAWHGEHSSVAQPWPCCAVSGAQSLGAAPALLLY